MNIQFTHSGVSMQPASAILVAKVRSVVFPLVAQSGVYINIKKGFAIPFACFKRGYSEDFSGAYLGGSNAAVQKVVFSAEPIAQQVEPEGLQVKSFMAKKLALQCESMFGFRNLKGLEVAAGGYEALACAKYLVLGALNFNLEQFQTSCSNIWIGSGQHAV